MKHCTPAVLSLLCPATLLFAGEPSHTSALDTKQDDWCSWLQSKPGTLYKNADNPWFSLLQVGGRFQYQAAYLDGEDVNGLDYTDTYDDYRRVRFETKAEFLKYFSINSKINMVNDERRSGGETDWGFDSFDELTFIFDAKKAFSIDQLDELKVHYGRHKFNFTEEVHMSSKEIYTLERSAMSNKLYGEFSRPTGLTVDMAKGDWSGTVGLFSGDEVGEKLGGWNYGEIYYASIGYKQSDELRYVWDLVYNDASGGEDALGYESATSLAAIYEKDRFGMIANVMLGDNGDLDNGNREGRQGNFGGITLMPWYWVVPEKLQAVARYQFQMASEEEGIRLNSRYVRSSHDNAAVDVNSGRGDEHHALQFGLNYYLCGDNAKIMSGVEFDHLETPDGAAKSVSYFIGFRTFF